MLDRVGDLEFAAAARADRLRGLQDRVVEQVDAYERQIGDVLPRLLDEPNDALAVEHRDPEPLRLRDLREEDLGVGTVPLELAHESGEALEEHVVAQIHQERLPPHERLRGQHRVRETERRLLREVGHAQVPAGSVANGRLHLVGRRADDDADLGDPRVADRLEREEQDRLVRDRDQLLGLRVGDRSQARTLTPGQHQGTHQHSASGAGAGPSPAPGSTGSYPSVTTTATSRSPSAPLPTSTCFSPGR